MKYPLIDLSIATCKWHIYISNEELQQKPHTQIDLNVENFHKIFLCASAGAFNAVVVTYVFYLIFRYADSNLENFDAVSWWWRLLVYHLVCRCWSDVLSLQWTFFLRFWHCAVFFEFVSFSGFLDLCWLNVGFIASDGYVFVYACIISVFWMK